MSFILASGSPRRKELLKNIGYTPKDIVPADISEIPNKKELPKDFSLRMAIEKAEAVHEKLPNDYILGADSVVALGRRLLQKAHSNKDVEKFLRMLSGRRHKVFTSICFITPNKEKVYTKTVESIVKFKHLSEEDIKWYVSTGEGIGKAGGYGIQGYAAGLVLWMSGSHSNIVGLPLYETRNVLMSNNIKPSVL